jgi:hypothetical protein
MAEFEAWLEEPITEWEAAEDERLKDRRKALERGEISA